MGIPQTISKLLTAAGSVLNIHGGSLILNNGENLQVLLQGMVL